MSKIKIRKTTPSVAYPSSLVQQSSKESIDGHGLIVWNLGDYSHEFVDIKNDFGGMKEVWTEWVDPENKPVRANTEAKLASGEYLVKIQVEAALD